MTNKIIVLQVETKHMGLRINTTKIKGTIVNHRHYNRLVLGITDLEKDSSPIMGVESN